MCLSVARIDQEGLLIAPNTFGHLAQRDERIAEVVISIGMARLIMQGLMIAGNRLIQPFLILISQAKIIMPVHIRGIEPDRLLPTGDGFVNPTARLQSRAQIGVNDIESRIGCNDLAV